MWKSLKSGMYGLLLMVSVCHGKKAESMNDGLMSYFNNDNYDSYNDYNDYNDYDYSFDDYDADQLFDFYDNDIIGGNNADHGEYPSIVNIGRFCGGTILSRRWILTAGHCVSTGQRVTVYAGDYTIDGVQSTEQIIQGTATRHPSYVNFYRNDIAVIRLDTLLTFNSHVMPIALSDASYDQITVGDRCFAVGWGKTDSTQNAQYNTLQEAELVFKTDAECSAIYGVNLKADEHICAGGPGTSVCNGDSGGPLFVRKADKRWVQVGVTSYGRTGCVTTGVFAQVSYFLNWISTTTQLNTDRLHNPVYDYPSCYPNCLENYGGCPNGVPCHQMPGRIYRVAGKCWKALTHCWGCLGNPAAYPQHLEKTVCSDYNVYSTCFPNCLVNYGGCPSTWQYRCHQKIGAIYKVGSYCYKALTHCWGCLANPGAYPTHLTKVTCPE